MAAEEDVASVLARRQLKSSRERSDIEATGSRGSEMESENQICGRL
jgi:hypothetical protein